VTQQLSSQNLWKTLPGLLCAACPCPPVPAVEDSLSHSWAIASDQVARVVIGDRQYPKLLLGE